MNPAARHRHDAGFTLLELLVALTIAGLAFLLVPPLISAAVPGQRLRTEAEDLALALRAARQQALLAQEEAVVTVDLEQGSYLRADRSRVDLPTGLGIELRSGGADWSGPATDARRDVRFFPDGSASDVEIELRDDHGSYLVSVDWLLGRVSVVPQRSSGT